MEEVGEASKEAVEHHFCGENIADDNIRQINRLLNFRNEMIQTAAVAVAILEDFPKRYPIAMKILKIKEQK